MKNKILFVLIGCVAFSVSAFVIFVQLNSNIIYSHANYIADFSDDNKIVGASENVFIARILKNKGEYQNEMVGPQKTLFEVEVLYNIKGKLKKKIEITQIGGYDSLGNLHLPYGTEYFEEGNIYTLVSLGENPYSILSHENGSHLIATKKQIDQRLTDFPSQSLKKIEKDIIRESEIVQELREAYINEVYYEENEEGKYKISNEKNAYKNLTKIEKAQFESFDNGYIE